MVVVMYPMSLLLYFGIVSLDVVMFFLVVRWLVQRWPAKWLRAFDAAGVQIVDGTLALVNRCLAHGDGQRTVRPDAALALSLLGVSLLRMVLWGLFRLANG